MSQAPKARMLDHYTTGLVIMQELGLVYKAFRRLLDETYESPVKGKKNRNINEINKVIVLRIQNIMIEQLDINIYY